MVSRNVLRLKVLEAGNSKVMVRASIQYLYGTDFIIPWLEVRRRGRGGKRERMSEK